MKKIMVLLLATAMLFASISCSNGNGSDSSSGSGTEVENGGGSGTGTGDKENEAGGSGSGNGDKENQAGGSGSGTGDKENGAGGSGSGSDVPSTSDCTEPVSTLELSDGEWTVYVNQTDAFMAMEVELKATVTNGVYEFTSGEGSGTVNIGLGMTEEDIEYFGNMSDEEKNALYGEYMDDVIPEGWKVSWKGLTVNVEGTLSADGLRDMEGMLDLEGAPEGTVIKTNADKTKYTINISFPDEYDGTTANMEIIAVKNN